ncbi:S8 family serine peptidase [Pollutimonas sp. M17]|uniref:S8 family serine peptidase n=1 Tax=Pollutimonas sp. M17 TaxID=2962065 RepID=UPI0021F4DB09|nr:S8 family serine peptidase [Pollutimonas sp. M17]UYO94595.1 S8 family serine peptidase [Pollutimonas sp. M17]
MAPDAGVTGRYLVLLCKDTPQDGLRKLSEATGVSISSAASAGRQGRSGPPGPQCAIVFDRIGVALVHCAPDSPGLQAMQSLQDGTAILAIEPERTVHAIAMTPSAGIDETTATWGVQAVGAQLSAQAGEGVRLAVLDTGIDAGHPDFAERVITSRSFIDGQDTHDGNGHGTHCAGIACGPANPGAAPRYGIAGAAQLFVGKVLGDEGQGGDGGVLEGIDWAIENRCDIVSMSLGSSLAAGQPYSRVFEEVARRALEAGTVIIAAAGNDSRRPEHIAPVSHPANCPSIVAVGAVDRRLDIAPFSSGGLVPEGGKVDIAAPGVDILSAWPGPQRYDTLSGTSMATPFVAGVAALYAGGPGRPRGAALLERLRAGAKHLDLPERDVGAGLVQAP